MKRPTYRQGLAFFVISWIFLWAVAGWILFAWHPAPKCSASYRDDTNLALNGSSLHLQVANSNAERQQGLGGKSCIGPNQGMLFVFAKAGYYPFWMRDMKFSIDIIWLSSQKDVTDVSPNVSPASYPKSFVNSQPAQYVIELAAGRAAKLGIVSGAHLDFSVPSGAGSR